MIKKAKTPTSPPSPTLTKAQMVNYLTKQLPLSKQQARRVVNGLFAVVATHLQAGHTVKLSGFGSFTLKDKKERPARNPKTGESAPVSARRVVRFRAGNKFRKRVSD